MKMSLREALRGAATVAVIGLLAWIGYGLQESNENLEVMQSEEYMNQTYDGMVKKIDPYLEEKLNSASAAMTANMTKEFAEMLGVSEAEAKEIFPTLLQLAESLEGLNVTEVKQFSAVANELKDVEAAEIREMVGTWRSMKSGGLKFDSAIQPAHSASKLTAMNGSAVQSQFLVQPVKNVTPSKNSTVILNGTSASNTTQPGASSASGSSVQAPGDTPEPVSNEPDCSDDIPPASASGGLPGQPPEELSGEYCGTPYTCTRDHSMGTPAEPVYRCHAEEGSPPDDIHGEYNGIPYRCTLIPEESSSTEAVYQCRLDSASA